MAVREGFEPSIRLHVYTLSRRAPSATQTPHRVTTINRVNAVDRRNVGKTMSSVNPLMLALLLFS